MITIPQAMPAVAGAIIVGISSIYAEDSYFCTRVFVPAAA